MARVAHHPTLGPIVLFECCQLWPIATLWPVGLCGLCGHQPQPQPPLDSQGTTGSYREPQ